MPLTISKGNLRLNHKTFSFPAGETSIKLDVANLAYKGPIHRFVLEDTNTGIFQVKEDYLPTQTIWARLQTSADVMELVMVVDALRRFDPTPINLVLSYVPYARQDRCCCEGEAFSLQAFARIINSLEFARVTVFDPHSDVTGAVLDNVSIINQKTIIGRFDAFNARLQPPMGNRPIFCSPDAGANKKVSELASFYGHSEFIRADKLRDLSTGRIKETIVYGEAMVDQDVIILDDIIDGGASFVPLAAALKAKGATRVELFATHGLFTKGFAPLLSAGIDKLWTTTSYHKDFGMLCDGFENDRFSILDLEDVFHG